MAADGCVERAAPLQVLDQLLVAERLAGGARDRPLQQRRDLADEAGVDHRLHTPLDPPSEDVARPTQAELRDGVRRVDVESGPERAERATAADAHLRARARRAGVFVGSIRAAAIGSSVGETGMERGRSDASGVLVELGTDLGPLSGKVDVVDHHPVVQAGAGDEQRPLAASGDVVERARGRHPGTRRP